MPEFEQEFQQELQCEVPEVTKQDKIARALWACYYLLTELYDRRICTHFAKDGTAMPADGREMIAVNVEANMLHRQLERLALEEGVQGTALERAKDTVLAVTRHNFADLERWIQEEGWDKTILPRMELHGRAQHDGSTEGVRRRLHDGRER